MKDNERGFREEKVTLKPQVPQEKRGGGGI
jgi:hypothetical protein